MAKEDTNGDCVDIFIMGKRYSVPAALTIMKAMEHAGYEFVRGCGCRGGFCGACATVYRVPGDYQIKVGLACQAVVEDGMHLAQIPFFPANKALYDLEETEPSLGTLQRLYPELGRCLGCNTCTKVCPQELRVMDAMAQAMRGNIARVSEMTFDCLMCGLCAARCPGEIVQYNIFMLARRLYGKYLAQPSQHLAQRVDECGDGKFEAELEKLTEMNKDELAELYNQRDIEK